MFFIPSTSLTFVTATSYLTLEEANEIISNNDDAANWNNSTDSVKQFILNQSSFSIDGLFSYQHRKTNDLQILKFPRNKSTVIPQRIKYAVCSLALSVTKKESFKNIKSETIGKMSWQFYQKSSEASDEIVTYLRPLKMKNVIIN